MMSHALRALVLAGLAAATAHAQQSVTFTDVSFAGTFGNEQNGLASYTFPSDFVWGGEIDVTWSLTPFDDSPRWDIVTPSGEFARWALGPESRRGFTPYWFSADSNTGFTGSRRFSPIGYRTSPTDVGGQTFNFRFFRTVDTTPTFGIGTWQSVTFTFLPYTPVQPPIAGVGDGITAPNGYLDFSFRDNANDFSERSIVGIYNAAGELLTRFNGTRFADTPPVRIDVSTWAPGSYYLGFGDNTTEFENRFRMTDYVDLEVYSGNLFITNGSGDRIGRFGQSPGILIDGEIFWSGFTLIPAPGAGVVLAAGMLLVGGRRKR
jgi:hypothetical protein